MVSRERLREKVKSRILQNGSDRRQSWIACLLFATLALSAMGQPAPRWWKGNLHTHSLWSDGDDFPEMVVDWYKARGYDFLAISDHNVLHEGGFCVIATNRAVQAALPRYLRRFGSNWVEQIECEGKPAVRLKRLDEYRKLFEAPNRFLLIQAEEITDRFGGWPIHLIASNIREFIKPRGGLSPVQTIQNNLDAVHEQRQRTGVPMMVHVAHPNFGWAITAEDMIQLRGDRFFELYNGHPHVHNAGDETHASTERMWDIINTHRIAERRDVPLLGLAVDDSHHYRSFRPTNSNPGRGWVMVRATELNPASIITALEAGNFYSSSGVTLSNVVWSDNKLTVRIEPELNVDYTIQFIGTRRPIDWRNKFVTKTNGHPLAVTRLYSSGIGAVFSEHRGTIASYTCKGDELYVRAKIISSRVQENAVDLEEKEMAWTQPVLPAR